MSATSPTQSPDRLVGFFERVLEDALADAAARQWRHRAETFEAAAHRPGVDWPGRATPGQLAAQRARCQTIAQACRQRAAVETTWQECEP